MSFKDIETVRGEDAGARASDLTSCVRYLAHELRNTLGAASGWVRVLRQTTSPADIAKAVEAIERNLRLHGALTDDLVDAAVVAAGGSFSAGTPAEVSAVLEQALSDVSTLAQRRDVRIDPPPPDAALRAPIDKDRLKRMVSGMLRAVIEAAPRQSEVSLRAASTDAGIEVRIEGPSSAPSAAEIPTSVQLVAIVARLHGGSLAAFAGADGAPTAFSLRLPGP